MSQSWSSNTSNSSRAGSETGSTSPRPFVRRSDDVVTAVAAGQPALTARNLAKNNTILANDLRKYQAPQKAENISSAAALMGIDLPSKTKAQLLDRYLEAGPMDRFQYGQEGGVGGTVDPDFWEQLVSRDPLAADIEREVRATRKK